MDLDIAPDLLSMSYLHTRHVYSLPNETIILFRAVCVAPCSPMLLLAMQFCFFTRPMINIP